MQHTNYKNNQAVQVLNKVVYDADGNPIGMCEDVDSVLSSNFGTVREPRRGGCYIGNDSIAYVNCGTLGGWSHTNCLISSKLEFDLIITSPITRTVSLLGKSIASGTTSRWAITLNGMRLHQYLAPDFSITYTLNTNTHYHIVNEYFKSSNINRVSIYNTVGTKLYQQDNVITATSCSNVRFLIHNYNDAAGTGLYPPTYGSKDVSLWNIKLYTDTTLIVHYKCDENYGSVCYDSSGNNYHGNITNAITTTPEENQLSIHQYQNIYSFHNEVGYNQLNAVKNFDNSTLLNNNLFKYVESTLTQEIDGVVITSAFYGGVMIRDLTTPIGTYITMSVEIVDNTNLRAINIEPNGITGAVNQLGQTSGTFSFTGRVNSNMILCYIKPTNVNVSVKVKNIRIVINDKNTFIPRNESIKLPPFKDVLGADLQYIGKVPSKALYVESCCFRNYNDSGTYLSVGNIAAFKTPFFRLRFKAKLIPQNDILFTCQYNGNCGWQFGTAYNSPIVYGFNYGNGSAITQVTAQLVTPTTQFNQYELMVTPLGVKIAVNDTYSFINTVCNIAYNTSGSTSFAGGSMAYTCYDGDIMDVKLESLNSNGDVISVLAYWPLCEEIINTTHVYHDISGNNYHATMMNGTSGNNGKQNNFHYLQKGFNKDYKAIDGNYSNLAISHVGYWTSSRSGSVFTFNKIASGQDGAGFGFASLRSTFTGDIWQFKFKIRFTQILSSITFQVRAGGASGYGVAAVQQPIINLNSVNTWLDIEFIANVTSQEATSIGIYVVSPTASYGHTIELDLQSIELLNPQKLPCHLTNNTDYLGNTLEYQQDGKSFLPSGCFIRQYQQPALVQADKTSGIWFDSNNLPYDVAYETLTLQDPVNEQIFIGNADKNLKLSPISTHLNNLNTRQKSTERVIREVVDDLLIEDQAFSFDINLTAADLTYAFYNPSSSYRTNAIIDWGDGNSQTLITATTTTTVHTYPQAGRYTIRVTGLMEYFNQSTISTNAYKCIRVNNWGNIGFKFLSFQNTYNLISIPNSPITGVNQQTLVIENLFNTCTKLAVSIPDNFLINCRAVTSVHSIFNECNNIYGSIPENIFRYCPNITNTAYAFRNCSNITGQIPEELLRYCPNLITISYLFSGCTKLSGSIPTNLLQYNTKLVYATNIFSSCANLTGIIPDLFRTNILLTTINGAFQNCPNLTGSIPSTLLKYNILLTDVSFLFYGCVKLTGTIPSTFLSTNTEITNAIDLFALCTGLTGEIPQVLFANNIKLRLLNYAFYGCTGITSIAANLFINNVNIISFEGVFRACTGISIIPTGIFSTNILVSSFVQTFYGCVNIVSLPIDIFRYNTEVLLFTQTFSGCSKLASINADLFLYNTKTTSFDSTFYSCGLLSAIPNNLFDTCVLVNTFINCFSGCTSITVLPVDLFKFNIKVVNFQATFFNTRITTIPANIFDSCVLMTNAYMCFASNPSLVYFPDGLFRYNPELSILGQNANQGLFYNCTNLYRDIPVDFFTYNTKLTKVAGTFFGCSKLYGSIPSGLLANKPLLTDAAYFFSGCLNLTGSIPQDLLLNSTALTTICGSSTTNGFFTNCINLTGTIPSTLFATNTLIASFRQCFQGCKGLTAIGVGLFDNNLLCLSMGGTFYGCEGLTSIPQDLFRYNIAVTSFNGNYYATDQLGVFGRCTGLTVIPEDLFYYNLNVTNYRGCFYLTKSLILPTRMFNTVNLGKVQDWQMFMNAVATYSPTGSIQKIWDTTEGGDVTYTVQPTKTDAFNNCVNLTNYAEIPVAYT